MKRRVLHIIATFIIVLGLVVIANTSKVFAKEENVKYVTELQEGDFIPANSVLLTDKTCVNMYSVESSFQMVMKNNDGSSYDKTISLENNSSIVVKDYSTTFATDENYDGWVVSSVYGSDYVKYVLKPGNSGRKVIQTPTSKNDYSMEYQCSSNNEKTYSWYQYKTVDDYSITPTGRTVWTANNGVYEVLENCAGSTISEAKLIFHFTAEKGDVVSFEIRGSREPRIVFNGAWKDLSHIPFSYQTMKFEVKESGEQQLEFIYYRNDVFDKAKCLGQVVVRNVNLLTKINDGNKLDTSKLNEGDNVYYECTCSEDVGYYRTDYVYKNSFQYKVNDGGEEVIPSEDVGTVENPEAIENPGTSNNALSIGALIVIFSILMVVIGIKSVKVDRS